MTPGDLPWPLDGLPRRRDGLPWLADKLPRSWRSRGATRWKLASYEVAGNAHKNFARPERTMGFRRPIRTDSVLVVNQTPCVWLISGCPVGTNAAAKIILRWTFGAIGV